MKNLTEEESKQYIKIAARGTMDDMFDWAYNLGKIHQAEKIKKGMEIYLKDKNKL